MQLCTARKLSAKTKIFLKMKIFLIILVFLCDYAACQSRDVCDGLNLRAPCDCHRPDRIMCRDRSVLYLDEVVWPEYVDVVEISLARNGINSVEAGHSWPKTLQILDLSRNRISSVFPSAFSRSCPDLEELNLAANFLTRLDSEALAGLTKLKNLDLSRNDIGEFRAEWFKDTKSVIRVDLSDNTVGNNVPADLFASLPRLKYLDLSGCSISFLPIELFENNLELEELRLARNPLTEVPLTQIYPARVTLRFLDLDTTQISTLPNRSFHGLRSLETLILDNLINLERIEPLAFHDLVSLTNLQIQGCVNLSYVDPFAFYNDFGDYNYFISVANVNLANNNLKFISQSLLLWRELKSLRLDGNPWRCDCELSWMAEEANLNLDETVICYEPEALNGFPIRQLKKDNYDCTISRHWIAGALFMSTVIVIILFLLFLCYQYMKGDKTLQVRTPPSDYKGWSRLQGLFHKDKLRSGYNRVMRSERANNFQVLSNENESARERELSAGMGDEEARSHTPTSQAVDKEESEARQRNDGAQEIENGGKEVDQQGEHGEGRQEESSSCAQIP